MTVHTASVETQVNWANRLTILRLILSPIFVVVFMVFENSWQGRLAALAIVIASELTDLFDGMVARRMNLVSDFGKILDPMADSLSRLTVFVCFIAAEVAGPYTVYLVVPILYRDAMMSTLRTFCAHRGVVVAARQAGKFKAVVQAIVILIILLLRVVEKATGISENMAFQRLYFFLILTATLITVLSAFDYIKANYAHLKATVRGEKN